MVNLYQEKYAGTEGTPIEMLPDEPMPLIYHHLTVYSENGVPAFVDFEGQRFALSLVKERPNLDKD